MPAAAGPGSPHPAGDEFALRSIRAGLLPEDLGEFDREFRYVMSEAMATLDLTGVRDFVRRWRRIAWSALDAQAHRRMLAHAEEPNGGAPVAADAWTATKSQLPF